MTDKDNRLENLLKKVTPISDLEAQGDENKIQQALEQFKADYKEEKDNKVKKSIELARFPTDLCRSTIFFPLPRKNRKAYQAEPVIIPFETGWSKIQYFGMKLSVQDEDLLLILLFLAKKEGKREFLTTFTELQKLLSIIPHPSHNKRFKDALKRLGIASFSINYKGKGQGHGQQWSVGGGILEAEGLKGKIHITFDAAFYSEFLSNQTLMSLPFRMRISGDLTKLLFTFLSSHDNPVSYFTDTLALVLNMNIEQEKKYMVKALKIAFKELQTKGFLVKYSYSKARDLFTIKTIERKEWKRLK